MTEMRRWLESDEIDDDVRELLGAAPVPRSMTASERARSARALGRIAALPAAAGLMFWVKNVALAGVLGAVGGLVVSGGVIYATDSKPEPGPVATAPAPASPTIERREVRSDPIEPAPASIPATPKRVAPAVSVPAGPEAPLLADSLALETERLEQARRALGTDPSKALALLAEHAREFPKGKLSAERELLAIDALIRLGRKDEARARASAMLERSRGGLYEQRLERMLRGL